MAQPYPVACFSCSNRFDAIEAVWCSCNPQNPTKVCPFCLGCFCAADESFRQTFWEAAPAALHDEMATLAQSRMLIGQMLVRAGLITTQQLLDALTLQLADGRRVGEILVEHGVVDADRLDRFLRSQHTVMSLDLARARVDAALLQKLGIDRCLAEQILPLEAEAFQDRLILTLAMADPSDAAVVERVQAETGCQIIAGVAPADHIHRIIGSLFPRPSLRPTPQGTAGAAARRAMAQAMARRASHIHFQVSHATPGVAFRIDGALYADRGWSETEAVAARRGFEEMAGFDPPAGGPRRTALLTPAEAGVDRAIVVRRGGAAGPDLLQVKIVEPPGCPARIEDCGLPGGIRESLERSLEAPHGLVIVSSPPFSGGSGTIRALILRELGRARTVGVVSSERTLTLPDGHVEECFDPEDPRSLSAAIARAEARGAGSLFLTSPDGASWPACAPALPSRRILVCRMTSARPHEALMRIVQAGYHADALATAPALLVHQVLARRLCPSCKVESRLTEEEAAALGLTAADAGGRRVWREGSCAECAPLPGLRGGVLLARALRPDAGVVRALHGTAEGSVLAACRRAGLEPLLTVAIEAMRSGLLSPAEVIGRSGVAAALDRM